MLLLKRFDSNHFTLLIYVFSTNSCLLKVSALNYVPIISKILRASLNEFLLIEISGT